MRPSVTIEVVLESEDFSSYYDLCSTLEELDPVEVRVDPTGIGAALQDYLRGRIGCPVEDLPVDGAGR